MGRFIGTLLDNESTFGKIMTKCGVIIGANLIFVLFSLPVITIGPGLAALSYVMLKSLRGDGAVNPFKTFFEGFRMNFRQGLICFAGTAFLAAFILVDIRFCMHMGGILTVFRYALYVLLFVLIILAVYLIPVMAAFQDTIPHLIRNALFFASRRPLKIPLAVALYAVPVVVTYLDEKMRPLYGFLWVVCLAGLISMMQAELMIGDIEKYLPEEDEEELPEDGNDSMRKVRSDREILKESRKLGQ